MLPKVGGVPPLGGAGLLQGDGMEGMIYCIAVREKLNHTPYKGKALAEPTTRNVLHTTTVQKHVTSAD